MNLVLTRNNQTHGTVGWEPFATSTPLKVVQNNVNVEKKSRKQFEICADSRDIIKKLQKSCSSTNVTVEKPNVSKQSVTKRPRKNKSCANFDLSSSSDEDNTDGRRRPVIKLSFKKQTNSTLKNKKSDPDDKFKNTSTDNNHKITSTETNKSDVRSLRQGHSVQNSKKKHVKALNLSSDEENSIFDKIKNLGNIISDEKLDSEKKENTELCEGDENCKLKNKPAKNRQKMQLCINNDNVSCKNIEDAVNLVKVSRSKKTKNKSSTPSLKITGNKVVTPLKVLENKTNTSHQLFSDSRGEELLNVLDLTSEEVAEAVENQASYLCQNNKLVSSSPVLPHPSNQSNLSETKQKKQQNLRKYQLLKNLFNKQLPSAGDLENNLKTINNDHMKESSVKNEEMICDGVTENHSEENELSCKKSTKRKTKVVSKIGRKKKIASNNAADNINNVSSARSSSDSAKSDKTQKSSSPTEVVGDDITATTTKPVFKLLNELPYQEDDRGCSAVECWDVNTFKCGVFKLKTNSQMKCKTLHKNSHLGGVLIKGKLKMKIGSKEHDLNQGDMAFVPPLTEWHATNIGECESIFYYWCGRFKI